MPHPTKTRRYSNMNPRNDTTAERVRDLLDLDPEAGVLIWKPRAIRPGPIGKFDKIWNAKYPGRRPEKISGNTYRHIKIDGVLYTYQRIVWLHYYGDWPKGFVDHLNGEKDDNRIANLRDVTPSGNCINKRSHREYASSMTGIRFRDGIWESRISAYGKLFHLGHFSTIEEARAAHAGAAKVIHDVTMRAGNASTGKGASRRETNTGS